ncbi:hypothetical protein ERJ75_001285800 [Trypanosoma vivax]|nr:hypothetical protein ERJ75_001285800 [Trypanosoma vivax]
MDGVECSVGFDDANEELCAGRCGAEEDLSTHRSGRATRSHRQCRRKCPETSVAEERFGSKRREPVAHRMQRGDMDEETGRRRWLSFFALWANTWRKHTTVMETASLPHDPPASAENEEAAPQSEAVRRWTHRHPTVTRPRACLMTRRRVPRMRKRHRSRACGGGAGDESRCKSRELAS